MGVLGRMVAGGIAAGADFAAEQMGKDYERAGELDAKKKLEEHAARLRSELEAQRQAWQSGENDKQIGSTEGIAAANRTSSELINERNNTSAAERQRGQQESAERIARMHETGANTRAGTANSIAEQQLQLQRERFELDKANMIPRDVQMRFNSIDARIKAAESELKVIEGDPMRDPDGKKAAALRNSIANGVEMQTQLLSSVRQPGGAPAAPAGGGQSSSLFPQQQAPAPQMSTPPAGGAVFDPFKQQAPAAPAAQQAAPQAQAPKSLNYSAMDNSTLQAILSGGEASEQQKQAIADEMRRRASEQAGKRGALGAAIEMGRSGSGLGPY